MPQAGYKQFCPVAMAADLLCRRWTLVLLRELIAGSTRFNDLRRGVPKMSPTLLSQRLRELEAAGLVERHRGSSRDMPEYRVTAAGRDAGAIVDAMGHWGHKWIPARRSLENLDPTLLMWDMRRNLDPTPLPAGRTVIHFLYCDLPPSRQSWWLVVEPHGEVDLCSADPGFDVDLHVTTDLRTMTAIWMGHTTVQKEARKLSLVGRRDVARSMQAWLGLSPFASGPRMAAA